MTLIGSRYTVVDTLGAGGMGVVHLAHDKLRNQQVALKQVLLSDDEQRLAITREFRTLSTLRHPNIVSVIEYGSHENQPYFTMEYLPESKPIDQYPAIKVEWFVQMLQALSYLHRRGVLHRDLKPGNVLVTPDNTVKVLDFGLAYSTAVSKNTISEGIAGTLRYMAPEILEEAPPTIGSDLWAIGVMLCEALTGHHPFDTTTASSLLMSLFSEAPNLSGMSDEFATVVRRLLSKDPSTRYANASEVIRDVCSAADLPIAFESPAQRESFLQAAAFVGRDREYQDLVGALNTTAGGKSQLWLIGGEAGAGKSRLCEEVRTRALVDGFVVLQGQSVEGGGLPYQVWRDPARKLVLGAPMSDLTASILKELIPDIAQLLGREVADVPELEPKAHRDRLMAALLERLKAQTSPVLIILEDLHWANEGLALLNMLAGRLDSAPVMVIATYRSDEKPTLPAQLTSAHLLTMERLSIEAVSALSSSMVGAENATPALVQRLTQETEGNVLFVVEVMRALAEEAGSLYDISRKSLPDKILSGGMKTVLQRRLSHVPAWALDTLKLAAVVGRVINLRVLEAAGVQAIETWLQACAEATVLEPYNGEWRFSHDRLRETLLNDLTDLAALHEKAAKALEQVYPDDVRYAEALAHHWRMAENPTREVHYIIKAAEYLITISDDYGRAERLLQRGLDLSLDGTRADLHLWMGLVASRQARFAEAFTAFQTALDSNPSPAIHALLLNRFGEVCLRQGKHAEAGDYIQQARAIAEQNDDQRNIALSLNLLGIVTYYRGDTSGARARFEESLVIGRRIGHRHSVSSSLNNLGNVTMAQGDYAAARAYLEDSLVIEREMGNRSGMAGTLNNLGNAANYQGDFSTSRAYAEETLRIYHEIGDRRGVAFSLESLGNAAFQQGDIEAALRAYRESLSICREIGVQNIAVYVEVGLVLVLVQMGEREQARQHLVSAVRASLELNTQSLMLLALLAASYWAEGQPERTAQWMGFMAEAGGARIKDDWRFKRQRDRIRAELGEERFDTEAERGKTGQTKPMLEALLMEITAQA